MDKPLDPGKYKKVVASTADTSVNTKSPTYNKSLLSSNGKFMVEKPDGSIGQWGNDLKEPAKPIPVAKKKALMSEKARGLSNTYQAPRDQQQGPDVPIQRKSNNYY